MTIFRVGHPHVFVCFGWHSNDTPSTRICREYGWPFHVHMAITTVSNSGRSRSGYTYAFPMFTITPRYLEVKSPYDIAKGTVKQLNDKYARWWGLYSYPYHGETHNMIHHKAAYFLYQHLSGYCSCYHNRWVKEDIDITMLQSADTPEKFWSTIGYLQFDKNYDGVDTKLDTYGRDMEIRKSARIAQIVGMIKEKKWNVPLSSD